jgi:DNA polymerase sigma
VYHPAVKEVTMLTRLSNTLVKSGICKSIEALKFTKVPLIKLQDKHTNINVDISFNRTNGIYCVKLVKFLQKKYPELKPLILILKAFLKSR